jgi:conjugal transfer pilus assembly protein TrbC
MMNKSALKLVPSALLLGLLTLPFAIGSSTANAQGFFFEQDDEAAASDSETNSEGTSSFFYGRDDAEEEAEPAQPPLPASLATGKPKQMIMPTAADIAKAKEKIDKTFQQVPKDLAGQQKYKSSVPNVGAIPKPQSSQIDIGAIADKYKDLKKGVVPNGAPDLLIFVSFSMPEEALQRAMDQSILTGASLVFRGLKGDSMKTMTDEIEKLVAGRENVSIVIHPPAFTQFTVTQVPAVVLARPEASSVLDNGCSEAETFVKITGDVSLDYALDYIERNSPEWAGIAHDFRAKLVRGI